MIINPKYIKNSMPIYLIASGFFLLSFQVRLTGQVEVPDSVVSLRIQHIQNILDRNKRNADLWNYGWIGAYSAGTAVQGVVYFLSNKENTKQDMALGAGTTLLAGLFQIIDPLEIGCKARKLAEIPGFTPGERQKKLIFAEETFMNVAKREKSGKSWKIHALNGAVNLGSGLITWLGFKRSVWDGIANFAMNSVISELQILTQPTGTSKAYNLYKQKYDPEIGYHARKPKPDYFVGAGFSGISFKIVF